MSRLPCVLREYVRLPSIGSNAVQSNNVHVPRFVARDSMRLVTASFDAPSSTTKTGLTIVLWS